LSCTEAAAARVTRYRGGPRGLGRGRTSKRSGSARTRARKWRAPPS